MLDNDKHNYIDENEAEKLLHRSASWLPQHSERGFITRRYLHYLAAYVNPTLARLLEGMEEELPEPGAPDILPEKEAAPEIPASESSGAPALAEREPAPAGAGEGPVEGRPSLHDQRF